MSNLFNTRFFQSRISALPALLSAFLPAFATRVEAAPAHKAGKATGAGKPEQSLRFSVVARFSYRDADSASPDPEQVVNAKFAVSGRKVRVESQLAGRPLIVLVNPPYAYRLLPGSKSGVRYRSTSLPSWSKQIFGSNGLLPDPMALRNALLSAGAKRAGSGKVGAVAADIYTATNLRGQKGQIKAWLRHSDALPLRLEVKSNKLSATASWSNYQRGGALPVALFTVPKDFHLRDGASSGR